MVENVDKERSYSNENIDKMVKVAMEKMLPTASGENYMRTYKEFQEWRAENSLQKSSNENELFAYLSHKVDSVKWISPGTLWCKFSMLRTTVLS